MSSPPLIVDYDLLCNVEGSLRVGLVRKRYGLESEELRHFIDKHGKHKVVKQKVQKRLLTKQDLTDLTDLYVHWRDTEELIPIRMVYSKVQSLDLTGTPIDPTDWVSSFNASTGMNATRMGSSNVVLYEGEHSEWQLQECMKRGNAPYVRMMRHKLKPLLECDKVFFSTQKNNNRKRVRKTRLLYITGTTAHKYCGACNSPAAESSICCEFCGSVVFTSRSISDAWLNFGSDWNTFVTNIRGQFNGCEFLRTWQSQKNGYPHFHALVYFPDYEFTAVRWVENDGSVSWRVHNRQMLRGSPVRDRIKDAWKTGSLDVKCCDSVGNAFKDLLKYITRDLEGGESNLTNAMVWYFGRQSIAVSDGFFKALGVNIVSAEPTNDDLINAEGVIQSSNSKLKLKRIEVFPTTRRDLLPDFEQLTLFNWKDPPPIGEKTVNFLDHLAFSCHPSKVSYREDGVVVVVYDRDDIVR